jgi:tetratricopeptide (TPR) repeat protein
VTGRELDPDVRDDLATLSAGAAAAVARHLVMAGRLLDEDPELAYQHAMAARRRGTRVGVVREAAGVAAYGAGHFAEALAELRAARRLTGSAEYLPIMADSERGLGRPRRALDLAADPAASALEPAARIELLIVAAGARRDLGEHAAAVVSLQIPELRSRSAEPWVARLRYAYADALEAAGRRDEAREWFLRAAESDTGGDTDAEDRLLELGDTDS